jgi:GxxExxY protein
MNIDDLTRQVIGCSFKIHRALGFGFLEAVYENALRIELIKLGISVREKEVLQVRYEGHVVGEYYPDLWIENQLIVEVKSVEILHTRHEVQLVNYLTATGVDNGLLLNFGSSVEVKRKFRQYKAKGSLVRQLLDTA